MDVLYVIIRQFFVQRHESMLNFTLPLCEILFWVWSIFFFKRIYCSYCIFIHNPCHFYIFCPNCVTSGTSIKHTQFALFSNPKYVSMVLYCCNAFFSKTKYQLYCLRKVWHPHPHTHSLSWLNEFFPSWLFDSSYTVAFSMCCVIHFKSKIPQWPKLYIEPCVQASFLCVCTVVALFRMFFFFFFFLQTYNVFMRVTCLLL